MAQPDTRYELRPWNQPPPRWSYLGPFASTMERLTQQALDPMFMSSDDIRRNVRPPLSQIQAFPPRDGYPLYQDRQAVIGDVVSASRAMPNGANFSGGPAGYTGSPRWQSSNIGLV